MPIRKTVDNKAVEPAAAAAEPKKRSKSAASKPKTPAAATHKLTTKKTVVEEKAPKLAPAPAAVPVASVRVPTSEQIAQRAYSYWEARGYQGGSPEADWLRAEQELLELAQDR